MTIGTLNGATRVIAIIGDPIAQVRSPAAVTGALQQAGRNAVVLPMHVAAADVDAFLEGLRLARNVDGIIATVPHKFAAYRHCATATERAHFLGAANVLRRDADGRWHGDMTDGEGFVAGARREGCVVEGGRALVVGAGGAGSAIAFALLEAGVADVAVHDVDPVRRDALVDRLARLSGAKVRVGSRDPSGRTIVVNATPAGMRPGDDWPVEPARLDAGMFVGDVVTAAETTPLIGRALALGCHALSGNQMFVAVCERMVAFFLGSGCLAGSAAPT